MQSKNANEWSGTFGNDYTERQTEDLDNRAFLFSDALKMVFSEIDSVCEFGANVGENIKVLQELFGFRKKWLKNKKMPDFGAIEINEKCSVILIEQDIAEVYCQSVSEPIIHKYDLVFTRGVLIHLPEEDLIKTVDNMIATSNKYILVAEYHNPERRMITYRGKDNMMWQDNYYKYFINKGCELIDYGFDPKYDITWFLMKKGE